MEPVYRPGKLSGANKCWWISIETDIGFSRTFGDRVARRLVAWAEKAMSLFFREKYDHHAVTLETIAAVPGIVGAAHRHLRSLRCMKRGMIVWKSPDSIPAPPLNPFT